MSTSSSASSSSGGRGSRSARRRPPPTAGGASTLGRPSEVMTATQNAGGAAVSAAGATTAAVGAGTGSPRSPSFRGRTMKEYEEMLSQLRKENFNLKLRLYFLEERGIVGAPGEGCGEAGDALRLELEQLRRDAADKQQLLCEAARAVELLEEQHREQLRAARTAAHQAQVEAQAARAHAQQLAADAKRAREEAEAELTAARKAAADAAAEAAVETERLRMELTQAREAAQEAAENARLARAVSSRRATPCSPVSSPPPSPLSLSPGSDGPGLRGAVERAQAQLAALEAELAAVRAELRRQTEARTAAERGLAEGRAVHAKSLQTVQALARLCKERGREAEGLRAKLNARAHSRGDSQQFVEGEERGNASGDEGVVTPRPSPAGSPGPLPPPPSPTASAASPPLSPTKHSDVEELAAAGSAAAAVMLSANVTLRRDVERRASVELSVTYERRLLLRLRSQLEDTNERLRAVSAERDALSGGLVRWVQALQARAREQDEELAARDAKLLAAEERAKRLEEELKQLKSSGGSRSDGEGSTPVPTPSPQDGEQPKAAAVEEDEKDRLIARLRGELRQRTANLQELVNKELWDKNRQIERLQVRLARLGSPAPAHVTTRAVAPVDAEQKAPPSPLLGVPSPVKRESPARSPPRPAAAASPQPPPPSSSPALPVLPPSPPPSPPPSHCASADLETAACASAGAEEEDEEELRRRLEESVRERACLAAQLDDLRRRVHDASASNASTWSESGFPPPAEAAVAAAEEAAAARAALARAEAGRRDALSACAALARRLDALARALPPLLRRHRSRGERRSASGGGGAGGGGGGGRRLRALERALSAAARAARALGSVEGAAEFALQDAEASADASTAAATSVDVTTVPGTDTNGANDHVEQEEGAPTSLTRVSESEVDAWSEPDRAVSMARVGLSPLSDRRAAAAAAAAATGSASSDEDLEDEAASRSSLQAGDPWASDDTIESSAEKLNGNEGSEMQMLRSRVAELETRVCEKDNELLEQQCALLEMRNTYTARCLQAEGQLSELLSQVRQVQADAEAERRSVRDQVIAACEVASSDSKDLAVGSPAKSQSLISTGDMAPMFPKAEVSLVAHAQAAAEAMEAERLSAEFALGLQQQVQVNEARQREAEAERRWRAADAALMRQRDAAAMAQSRAALERTQLLGERVRLERALRREEATAAAAARAHRHERRQLQEQVLALQASNRRLSRQMVDLSTLHLSPPRSPSAVQALAAQMGAGSPRGAGPADADHDLGVCPLSAFRACDRDGELGSLGSGLDAESLCSTSPPPPLSGSPWLLPAASHAHAPLALHSALHHPHAPRSLPSFSRQHSALSTGYASAGDCGPASPQTCGGTYSWVTTRPPGEPSHGAGSPDLGIESDAGRFSSLEPLSSHCGSCDQESAQGLCGFQGTDVESEFTRLQKENSNLKRNLSRTKKLLEATVTQLSSSNQLKRQMEMTICKQLNKTHNVLKQAKADCDVPVEPVK